MYEYASLYFQGRQLVESPFPLFPLLLLIAKPLLLQDEAQLRPARGAHVRHVSHLVLQPRGRVTALQSQDSFQLGRQGIYSPQEVSVDTNIRYNIFRMRSKFDTWFG